MEFNKNYLGPLYTYEFYTTATRKTFLFDWYESGITAVCLYSKV